MKKIITLLTLTISSIFLSACGGGGTTATDNGSSLTLVNAYGTNITVSSTALKTGISTSCFPDYTTATTGRIQTLKIVDSTYTWTVSRYANDLTCSGTPAVGSVVGTYTVGSNTKIAGWDTVPNKASDNATPLPTDASYTILNSTVTSSTEADSSVGDKNQTGYIIDDSSSNGLIIYNLYMDTGFKDQPYIQ